MYFVIKLVTVMTKYMTSVLTGLTVDELFL